MSEQDIAEAMQLMSSLSLDVIRNAALTALWPQDGTMKTLFTSFGSPAPPISAGRISTFASEWNSPEARLQRLEMRHPITIEPPRMGLKYHEEVRFDPRSDLRFWKGVLYEPTIKVNAKWNRDFEALVVAAKKCGVTTTADLKDAKIEDALKGALTRQVARTAVVNGVWQSALLTSVFDIKLLFDGDFKKYLIKVGVSGLYGGTVGGLSSWLNHPFFGNGIVLGVFVGGIFGTASLISTGDFARFGKTIGVSVTGGAAAWGGGALGGLIGSVGGPIGTAIGTGIGSIAAGYFGRQAALKVPGFGGMTEHEVQTAFTRIKEQLAQANMQPDPSLSPQEVVAAALKGTDDRLPFPVRMTDAMAVGMSEFHDALRNLQESSPEKFAVFLDSLRAASVG